MIDLASFGSSQPFQLQQHDLIKIITSGSKPAVTSPLIINAIRQVDRTDFLPGEFKHLAYQDRLLKIAYNEVLTNPTLLAKLLQYVNPQPGQKYLHLGTGTGYLATLLANLVGNTGEVYSLERINWYWDKARQYTHPYRQKLNLEILYRDGLKGLRDRAPYDGIISSFIFTEEPTHLIEQLAVGGKLIFPTTNHYVKVIELQADGEAVEWQIPDMNSYAFGLGKEGVI